MPLMSCLMCVLVLAVAAEVVAFVFRQVYGGTTIPVQLTRTPGEEAHRAIHYRSPGLYLYADTRVLSGA